uniref:Thioredoxin domain-containing protein n=1 Tax=Setaria digitata TaxID=48799 RepID=A0A915PU45_9BILA
MMMVDRYFKTKSRTMGWGPGLAKIWRNREVPNNTINRQIFITEQQIPECAALDKFLVGIKWMPYWVALLSAQSQHKPIFLLVYDDRCPECRRLKSEIEDSPYRKEFEQLSKNFVMTNVNDKEIRKPDDKEFSPDGHYKPRILPMEKESLQLQIPYVTNVICISTIDLKI